MPWQETNVEMERVKFIAALSDSNEPFAVICRRFGISRQTGYEWKRRFEEGGCAALADRRPDAASHPNITPEEVADAVVSVRKAHPTWGPKKVRAWLHTHHPELAVPAASTIGDILKRRGLVAARKRRLRVPPRNTRLSDYTGPNAVWCIDHKGSFALAGRERCYPLTMCDGYSRYLLKCEALPSTSEAEAWPHVEAAFREFGLPVAMRSDNGVPFATTGPGGLSRMAVWWVKLGIRLERIQPGHPQENGRLERLHRTLEEAIGRGPRSLEVQRRRFDVFRGEYNLDRPHESLDQKVPASAYETSWRSYPAVLRTVEYEDERQARSVDEKGTASWRGHTVRVGRVLCGERVYFEETGEDRWDVRFGPVYLMTIELRGRELATSSPVAPAA